MARITVVNHYPDFIETMTGILDEMAGHEVIGFDVSDATLDTLTETRPQLLVLDIDTADMVLGRKATASDRAAIALGSVPMIVCSGDIAALRERAEEFGDMSNVHMLEKPFTLEALTNVVERALYRAAVA